MKHSAKNEQLRILWEADTVGLTKKLILLNEKRPFSIWSTVKKIIIIPCSRLMRKKEGQQHIDSS